jgi:hypothetical protein
MDTQSTIIVVLFALVIATFGQLPVAFSAGAQGDEAFEDAGQPEDTQMLETEEAQAAEVQGRYDEQSFTVQPRAWEATYEYDTAHSAEVEQSKGSKFVPNWARKPVIMNFDHEPKAPWAPSVCSETGAGTASHGILTINSPSPDCYEYFLFHRDGVWHRYVSNSRGWIIEASLKVDPSSFAECADRGTVQIWAHDHRNLIIVGISTHEICLAYPENVRYEMDTSEVHAYRIESKGRRVRIYVDGELKIEHVLTFRGEGTDILSFGDGTFGSNSLSQWDYFSYDIYPNFRSSDWK